MATEDKHWAQKYLIDPLNEPEPSALDGSGTSFRPAQQPSSPSQQQPTKAGTSPTIKEQPTGSSTSSTNPFRHNTLDKNGTSTTIREHSTSDRKSAVKTHTRAISASSAEGGIPITHDRDLKALQGSKSVRHHDKMLAEDFPRRGSDDPPRPDLDNGKIPVEGRHRRASSLKQRYPGDMTGEPLEMLTKHSLRSQRSPHLRKMHQPRPDQIDSLDDALGKYHHEGPYDAALMVRNTSTKYSPVAALRESNNEALRATPRDKIADSLNDHQPLDGTAMVPPGQRDVFGRRYNYKEGTDMMREPGADYKRWPGVDYLPEDLKGKGEPSYSIEEDIKKRARAARREARGGSSSNRNDFELAELAERPRTSKSADPRERLRRDSQDPPRRVSKSPDDKGMATASGQQRYGEWEAERRRHSRGKNLSGEIKKRLDSGNKKDA